MMTKERSRKQKGMFYVGNHVGSFYTAILIKKNKKNLQSDSLCVKAVVLLTLLIFLSNKTSVNMLMCHMNLYFFIIF